MMVADPLASHDAGDAGDEAWSSFVIERGDALVEVSYRAGGEDWFTVERPRAGHRPAGVSVVRNP
jgi:hypothetical protein